MEAPPDVSFEFGLPPLRTSPDTWTLRGPLVHKNGELWLDLREVTQAFFRITRPGGGRERMRFVLSTRQRSRSIYTDSSPPGSKGRASWVGAHELVVALLDRIDHYAPDARVTFGAGRVLRWILFAWVGLLTTVLVIVTVTLASLLQPLSFLTGAMVITFGALCWFGRPWRPRRRIAPREAAVSIAAQPPLRRRSAPRHF